MTDEQQATNRLQPQGASSPEDGSDADASPSDQGEQPTAEELRADIEQAREELGETVEALAGKADVKARSRAALEQRKQQARAKGDELKERIGLDDAGGDDVGEKLRTTGATAKTAAERNPVPTALGVAATVAVVVLIARRIRRR